MTLGLIIFPMSALLAVLGLLALTPDRDPHPYVLPAVRTVALLAAALVYITAIWSW
jgi:hypothetical protein